MTRTRILLADASPLFRAGVHKLLARETDLEVLSAAGTDELADRLDGKDGGRIDLALVDFDLPPDGGLDAVARVRHRCDAYVIVWTIEPSRDAVLAAIAAGAHGFLHKEISPDGLVRAIRGTLAGEAPLSRDLASVTIEAIHALREQSAALERAAVLSAREKEVLALIARGARNREIAGALTISEFTVKRHVQNILHKLQLPSRRAAASFYSSAFSAFDLNGRRSA